MKLARRGFLFGLGASLVAAPSIVRACNIMPVKIMDTFHKVWIEGRDWQRNPITKIIEVRESLTTGLDMAAYKDACALIEPEFLDVNSITWSNEINKIEVSPDVDRYIAEQKRLEAALPSWSTYRSQREIIDEIPHVGSYDGVRNVNFKHKDIPGVIPGMVNRGCTVALSDETYPY